jgi:hypothetical protein
MNFWQRIAFLFAVGLSGTLALLSTLYTFTTNALSARFIVSTPTAPVTQPIGDNTLYFKVSDSPFSRESWACGLEDIRLRDDSGAIGRVCRLETGARWITIASFVLLFAIFVLLAFDCKWQRLILRRKETAPEGSRSVEV